MPGRAKVTAGGGQQGLTDNVQAMSAMSQQLSDMASLKKK